MIDGFYMALMSHWQQFGTTKDKTAEQFEKANKEAESLATTSYENLVKSGVPEDYALKSIIGKSSLAGKMVQDYRADNFKETGNPHVLSISTFKRYFEQKKILTAYSEQVQDFWKNIGTNLLGLNDETQRLNSYSKTLAMTTTARKDLIFAGLEPDEAEKILGKEIGKITTKLKEDMGQAPGDRFFILPPNTFERFPLNMTRSSFITQYNAVINLTEQQTILDK